MSTGKWSFVASLLLVGLLCLPRAEAQDLPKCDLEILTAIANCATCGANPNSFIVRS